MEYVWSSNYNFSRGRNGINICGGSYAEGKFTEKIDVSFEHNGDSIKIGFGSTLDDDA